VRTAPTEHVALLTVHHIVADGWSLGVLVGELAALYAAFVQGRPSPLPPLAIQYADFSVWQRRWLADGVLQRQLAYWTDALRDAPTLLALPTDRPRPAQRAYRGAHAGFVVDAALTTALKALGRSAQSTLFMVLMAAFDVLLARCSGERDVCVGTAVANRNRHETEPLIGLFVNTLVMRARVDLDAPFTATLRQVRDAALQAYANQDVPFEHVVDAVAPARSLSHQPLFQVMLLLQNTPEQSIALPGLSLQSLGTGGSTAKCDLILNLSEAGGELQGDFEYDTDLFDAGTIEGMARRFVRLLRGIVAEPACRAGALPLLDEEERRRLAVDWNPPATAWPAPVDVISLFEAQAAATPARVAVAAGDEALDYRTLDARANRIAWTLARAGVGLEDRVGVLTERGIDMMAAVLGTMKTGAAYVPLDPDAGAERLAFIVQDARPRVVLTQRHLLDAVPASAARVVCVDDAAAVGHEAPPFRRAHALPAEALAYLIYTSGSTGVPKAVQVRQEALANLLRSMSEAPGIVPDDVMLSVTSLAFDLVVPNLFLPLIHGARTIYAPRTLTDDPEHLAALMERHGVTLMQATPATWRMLVEHRWPALRAPVKLLCGGDALGADLAARLLAHVPVIWNMYGPTETTVWSSFAAVARPEDAACVGRPIANTRMYVLDEAGELVPPGVAGELHIAGRGLARGYLGRAGLTAEKFLPDPFCATPGARMYRTGDLARHRADGRLECLGRIDGQVKLRGFRIEPGEIEAAIARLPGVRENAVVAHDFGDGDVRLVAYVIGDDADRPDAAGVRSALAAALPDYMVPAHVVALERMPLTTNGKLDRRALPMPRAPGRGESGQSPRGDLEQRLAVLWGDLLRREHVGRDDHFFESGGHSLLATRLVARIRRDLGVDLPLRALFESPTLAQLARRIAEAAPERVEANAIVARPRTGPLPLSAPQQRLWFLDQLQPGNPAYVIPLALRLTGSLDVRAFAAAINEVVRRHEVLRTSFPMQDASPVQRVADALTIDVPVVALDAASPDARAAQARARIDEAALAPFDLAAGPLIRARLLRLAAEEHVAVVTLHHAIADGWSLGVLVQEVGAIYGALREGRPSPLPPLWLQYGDFARWQRERLDGGALQSQLRYWAGQLAGAPALLALPTDRPRPAVQGHRGASVEIHVPAAATEALGALARQSGATLFMALGAAFGVLLARYSGQDDICIGTPVANRRQVELEPLIGLFVNTLVLRQRIDLRADFATLLARARDAALQAYAHQDVPFEQVVDALKVERHLSHSPLFQVMMALQDAPAGGVALPGLQVEPLDAGDRVAKFDLTLYVAETHAGLACTFEYATDLFDAATMGRMARHFVRLLEGVAAAAHAPVGTLPLLAEGERQQVLEAWNATADDDLGRDAGPALHAPFERQAALAPQAPAVVFEGAVLTYGELDARANRLAHHLRGLGVGTDQRVAICVERSLEMMTGLLAILKAGAAYVPLDPAWPPARLGAMLADAGPVVLLTQRRFAQALPPANGTPVVFLDDDAPGLDALPATAPALDLRPGQLAYVIYTSGSTGRPKGVGIDHAGICNRLAWMQRAYRLGPADRVLQKTPLTFDVSVWELFWPLREGATLVVARPGGHKDPAWLQAAIERERITTLHFVPPMLEVFLQAPGTRPCASLRQVLCSGQALPMALQRQFFAKLPGVALHNLYGPTEASVDVTAWACDPRDDGASVPIGTPISNTRIYVLDEAGEPVPPGVAGELHIAGICLARGYLGRPGLTAEKFVPDPFAAAPGARMYRSGDLARHRADGRLEYLGRIDGQVKLRGLRIEPGEIEAAIAALPGVRENVVLAHDFGDGDLRLVAYVVGQDGGAPDAARLREWLAAVLPDYMVPAHVVELARMPLTANGKLDRRALPAPEATSRTRPYEAPTDEAQRRLASIWAMLLKRDRVGRHDHFFESGGHSLLATRLVAHLRRDFGVELPLRAVFEAPTLEQLARRVADAAPDAAAQAPIRPVARTGPPPLSASQQRLWFLDQLEPGNPAYAIPLALRLAGRLDVRAFSDAVNAVVARHEALRTTFPMEDGHPVQRIAPALPVDVPVVALDALPPAAREARARASVEQAALVPFDLAAGPLLRASLLRLDAEEHVAVVVLHHIVADGWSLGVMMDEICAHYDAALAGRPADLPALAIQYADFATWQRERLARGELDAQRDYWLAQLADAPALLSLPLDRPRPSVQGHVGATVGFAVPEPTAAALRDLGWRHDATLFMTIAAAFVVLLARHAGQSDLCIGTPVANRRQAELEPLVGLFVNTLVLRSRVDLHASFDGLLAQVRETALAAYAHQDLPFEDVVEALQVPRHLSHSPLFQAMLVVQNTPVAERPMTGLAVQPFAAEGHVAKFDLTLTVHDGGRGLQCELEYATDLFDAATAQRLARHFGRLLDAIAAAPSARVGALAMLDEGERARIVREWNDTAVDYAALGEDDATLHARIERQAALTPDAPAVICGDRVLSYAELDARAGALARHLRARHGLGARRFGALLVERSPEMMIGLLAILKTGAAYVPLDPAHPPDRLAATLADAAPAVLLTQRRHADRLPPGAALPVVLLDDELPAPLASPACDERPVRTRPGELAYVLYTSGSTGRPKGVMVSHFNLLQYLRWAREAYPMVRPVGAFAQLPLVFDASVTTLFLPLLAGKDVRLPPPGPGAEVFGFLREPHDLALLKITPAHVDLVAAGFARAEVRTRIETTVIGGEALSASQARTWLEYFPHTTIVNEYGPTEATVGCTAHRLRGEVPHEATVPIGRPAANTQLLVLDPLGEPAPIGVAGELHIAGDGLARGYFGQPGLTAEKFIPNPFADRPGARMYRSGDLARTLADGTLEFLGRLDDQLKIRGFRIEPGEVEAAITRLPGVRDAFVTAWQPPGGGTAARALVAYVVAESQADGDVESLRAALRDMLPSYMVPSHFVRLAQLPLTANGKVDRRALPAPRPATAADADTGPWSDTELELAAIWRDVLRLPQAGRHDNFFDVGGNSLLAVQLVNHAGRRFAVALPIRAAFEFQTIAAMAACIDEIALLRKMAAAGTPAAESNTIRI
jgi:amino acid adenylation domain-containing protein